MKGGIGQLMKQAQKMQEQMQQAQEDMAKEVVTGEAGAGMVRITMNCRHEVQGIAIDDAVLGDDKEMLEDLIIAAFNDAVRRVAAVVQEKFSGMAGGLSLPPGMKLPF